MNKEKKMARTYRLRIDLKYPKTPEDPQLSSAQLDALDRKFEEIAAWFVAEGYDYVATDAVSSIVDYYEV